MPNIVHKVYKDYHGTLIIMLGNFPEWNATGCKLFNIYSHEQVSHFPIFTARNKVGAR